MVPGKTPMTAGLASASRAPAAGADASTRARPPADDALVAVHPDDSWLLLPSTQEARTAAIQRRAQESSDPETIQTAAARGVATPEASLPHQETLEAGFGQDLSDVTAHVGGDAAATAAAMGAEAYAAGDHVVLPAAPSLHTTAHEVAHVLQQREGVSLLGGVGSAGDPYEREADALADGIVAGETGVAPAATRRGAGSAAVQRKETAGAGDRAEELPPLLEANIRGALAIPVPSGNLEAARVRLVMLEAFFRALHRPNRRALLGRLEGASSGDELARQFRYRLSTASRQRLLAILRDDTPAATEEVATAQDAGTEVAGESTGEQRSETATSDDIHRTIIGEASTPVGKMARVSAPAGLRLRTRPAGDADTQVIMPFDTLVHVDRETKHGWCFVHALGGARSGEDAGGTGFCERQFLVLDPPEPGAHLHRVAGGEMLKDIAARYYRPANGFQEGSDARLYVEAIYEANRGRDHAIRRVGSADLGLVDSAARSDAEEKTLRIFQTVQVMDGQSIWIPSPEMIKALRDAGSITGGNVSSVWGAAKNALAGAGDFAQQLAGYYVGLLEGAFGAVKDLVMGIVDLLEMLYDLVKSLWNHGFVGTCKRLWKFVTDLWDNKEELAAKFGTWFMNGWCNEDPFDRGRFQGEVIGYVAMTVLLILATAGGSAAAQAGGKFGTVIKAIRMLSAAGELGTYTGVVGKGIKGSKHLRRALGVADDAVEAAGDAVDTAGDVARHVDAPVAPPDGPATTPDVDAPAPTREPAPEPPLSPDVPRLDGNRFQAAGGAGLDGTMAKNILVDATTGKKYLWKPNAPDAPIPMRAVERGITPESIAGRAKASEIVARQLDIDTPDIQVVEYDGKIGSLQEWRKGKNAATLTELKRTDPARHAEVVASPEYQRMRSDLDALDHVLDNLDRNDGNLMIEMDEAGKVTRITAIDHDLTFSANADRFFDELGSWARALPEKYNRATYDKLKKLTADPDALRRALGPHVSSAEIDAALARADQVITDIETKLARHGEKGVFFDASDAANVAGTGARRADASPAAVEPEPPTTSSAPARSSPEPASTSNAASGHSELGPATPDSSPDSRTGAPPRGRTPAQLRELEAQLPPELRGDVSIVDGDAVAGSGVHVTYKDGNVRIEVGPDAEPRHVAYHVQTAKHLLKYQGPLGKLRQLLDAIRTKLRLSPGYGTEGFEAREEVRKLLAIRRELEGLQQRLDGRARALETMDVSTVDASVIDRELAEVSEQLEDHLRKIDSYEPGRGFIAAEGKAKQPEVSIRRDTLFEEIDEDEFNIIIRFGGLTPDGREVSLGRARISLDPDGNPQGAPVLSLEARVVSDGREHAVHIYDDVVETGGVDGPPVHQGQGTRTPTTGHALDTTLAYYKRRFGRGPEQLEGTLAMKNLENFQREYAAAIARDLSHDEAAQSAIRSISFGRHRVARGYDQFEVVCGPLRTAWLPDGSPIPEVPESVFVIARPSGGVPDPLAPRGSDG
jgi:hypothetical protein